MIQNGDKFTVFDLRSSVRDATSVDMCQHVHNIKKTPNEYAKRCLKLYGDVKSSAVNLDRQLKDAGFKTTYRFAHEYNIAGLTPEQIVCDAYKLEYFYKLATGNPNIKFGHKAAVMKIFDDAARVSYYYAQYIWAANPMARFDYADKIHMYRDWGTVLNFLLGVGFLFHPKDVYEFTMRHNAIDLDEAGRRELYARQLTFKNWCMNKYNIDTGCLVLCQEHRDKLAKILTRTDTPYVWQLIKRAMWPVRQY
ncbi:MAG: hypothetical protein IJD69_00745 [Alphaproteobacteria bacterium]|nr:hypothetical protein [Alphaproteobacteria bacterium]